MSQSTLPDNLSDSQVPEITQPESETTHVQMNSVSVPVAADLRIDDEFDYKPISLLSPITLILGLSSLVVFVTAFGIIVGAIGSILGTICFLSIMRNRSEVGGFFMTAVGLVLCFSTALYGSTKLVYDYQTELPQGFERISFANDIAEKEFTYEKGKGSWGIHEDVLKLDGEAIFLKGFMYPTRQTKEITEFILAKDNGDCCFGGEPKVTDMILVRMKSPQSVDFSDKRVSIAGTFKVTRNQTEGLTQVYEMSASHFEISKTAF